VISVVVAKLFPVRVFFAVTVTPGRGIFPDLITPCKVPPAVTAVDVGAL
jgi:hypothetical protein